MRLITALLFAVVVGVSTTQAEEGKKSTSIELYNGVVFYDGYAKSIAEPVPEGLIRLKSTLYSTRLGADKLALLRDSLTLEVTIGALCDNYDRIGSVHLAMVPKGADRYDPDKVERIELGRFITPFMNKNKQPDKVPYRFNIDHIVPILKDVSLLANNDFWVEFQVFGSTGAGRKEVAGCKGRMDTFQGWMSLTTDSGEAANNFDVFLPLSFQQHLNNYKQGASDQLGVSKKTFEIKVPVDTHNAQLVLITSNHGANSGGEEYNRRQHLVYFDGSLVHEYTPGRKSCEPFRQFNTQGNGIYGRYMKTPKNWQSFSNWCPGDRIKIRIIKLGEVKAGQHRLTLDVPEAVFKDKQGYIPVSLYFQGSKKH
ncbi:peptide-N-glycosidase F-related protein [Porticoccaceae bacterium LTM1]|nr:peptide-N-glycosidase F-related protein [Porticoccaceae bacterium LTM1]